MAADGQVTMGERVFKHTAKKIRRLYQDKILAGFAGSTADAFSLFSRFETQAGAVCTGTWAASAVELAKDWRTDKMLRNLEALLLVADLKPDVSDQRQRRCDRAGRGHCGDRQRGSYALAAARALMEYTEMGARDIAEEALTIAGQICIYTNDKIHDRRAVRCSR